MTEFITEKSFESYDIGTKAKNLFIMSNAGIPVPSAVCIGADSAIKLPQETLTLIRRLSDSADYDSEDALESVCSSIKTAALEALSDSDKAKETAAQVTQLLGDGRFSVRSSSSAEDSAQHSFAGQFDTYLNVEPHEIYGRVLLCALSKYRPGVLKYCRECAVDINTIKMNVIIEKMIDSDVSGVVFTANPQGLLSESVIVAGAGTGDNIVEDKVPVTTYYFNNIDSNYCYERQNNAVQLSDATVRNLIKITEKIKSLFGEYLDIEFALEGEKLWILQARPITTIDASHPTVLDNSNIVESYPGVSLPLSASFALEAYTGIFKGVAKRFVNNKTLERFDSALSDMVACVNGRMYYKIGNWYTVIKFLPFSKKIIPVWQEMMGVSIKSYDGSANEISSLTRAGAYIGTVKAALSVRREMAQLGGVFDEVERLFNESFSYSMSNEQLLQLYDTISDKLLARWDVTLLNDMYAFCFTGVLKALMKDCREPGGANELISGLGNLESMKPLREMIELSRYAAMYTRELDTLRSLKSDEEARSYLQNDTKLSARLKGYIESYGDRCPEELKLESVTFRTSPLLFLKKIVEYADAGSSIRIAEHSHGEGVLSNEHTAQYGAIKRRLIKAVWTRAAAGIRNREESRLNRCRIYGMVREIFLAAAGNLTQQGAIDSVRDIFYCTCDEVFAALRGGDMELKQRVLKRKESYSGFALLPPCSRLVFAGQPYDKCISPLNPEKAVKADGALHGTPCSGGTVKAQAAVVANPGSAGDVRGKIIVTRTADPGWVFLLTLAGGIIAEKGSLLSHTAIISREIGIPSVVGVKDATEIIRDGDIVTINGDTGEISISEKEKM